MIQKIEIGYWSLNWGQVPFDKDPTLRFAEWDYFCLTQLLNSA